MVANRPLWWLLATCACMCVCAYQDSGVRRASFWPLLPLSATQGDTPVYVNAGAFQFLDTSTVQPSDVQQAINIYKPLIFPAKYFRRAPSGKHTPHHSAPVLVRLDISAVDPVARTPTAQTDESYELSIPNEPLAVGTLKANTYVGVLRGLETFSQLLVFGVVNGTTAPPVFHVPNAPWEIRDQPHFPHRGLLIDPSRTYLPVDSIKTMLDGLLFSKMNVLHLHLSDSQSFPIQLSSYPNITFYGAYSEEEIYTAEDLADLVQYATLRGVRLIPEIESSSHSRVFGLAPELRSIVACADVPGDEYDKFCAEPPCGQVNPADSNTLPVVTTVIQEVVSHFPDTVVHLGFDEINQNCWLSDPRFQQYLVEHNYTIGQALQQYFIDMRAILQRLLPNKTYMYWEEAALQNPALPIQPTDIVQVWNGIKPLMEVFQNTQSNVVLSMVTDVYLDCGLANVYGNLAWCQPYNTWLSMFTTDPLANITNPEYINRVLGGESCIWGEIESSSNIYANAWPRAAAFAGRLWNYYAVNASSRELVLSMSDHTQRLIARGVGASPVTVPLCSISPELCF